MGDLDLDRLCFGMTPPPKKALSTALKFSGSLLIVLYVRCDPYETLLVVFVRENSDTLFVQ